MKISLKYLLFTLVFFVFTSLFAQNAGWEAIKANDFVKAKQEFESIHRLQPKEKSALVGLLFLAETVQDQDAYVNYANALMQEEGFEPYFWLFEHLNKAAPEALLKQKLPTSLRFGFGLNQADTLFYYRRFEEAVALHRTFTSDWNWAVTGPFTNVSGSGFLEKTKVETEAFNLKSSFKNDHKTEFSWLKRLFRSPEGLVGFNSLPPNNGLSTYYANTFIKVPTDRKVQLRLTHHEPLKIWIDDQLLVSKPKNAPFLPDVSVFDFSLTKGTHRILVKISEFPEEAINSKVKLAFNDVSMDNDNEVSYQSLGDGENNGNAYSGTNENGFYFRLVNPENGQLLTDITSDYDGSYSPQKGAFQVVSTDREYLDTFKKMAANDPKNWMNFFLLAKTYGKYEAWEEGEAYFANAIEANPDAAFFKFILAKFYDANDKGEKAESLLSEMDTLQTPTLAEHFMRLSTIDVKQNEAEYLTLTEKMLQLSPTNYSILNQYLEFLKGKGKKEQVQSYVKQFLATHKDQKWKDRFEDYLKEDSYKPESYKPQTDKERDKNFKNAKKRLKKRFDLLDYSILTEYYKNKDKKADVLRTMEELAEIMPWSLYRRFQKAQYLFEKEESVASLAILKELEVLSPYDDNVFDLIGDIYIEQKNETEALAYYKKADKIGVGGWGGGNRAEKIEKLENRKKYNQYFQEINLEEVVKNLDWKAKYKDEESVISFYSQQLTYLKNENKVEGVRKMIIHIQNEAGAKFWTEGDFRQIGRITSAKIVKKDGSVSTPDLSYNFAVFKNLQAGDVIFVEGNSEVSMPDDIPGEFLSIDMMSWKAPIALSTFELLVPKEQELYFTCNRLDSEHSTKNIDSLKMLRWEWRNIAKLEEEEAAVNNLDQYAYMMTGSVPDWTKVINWYQQKTYCRTDANYEVLQKARQLITKGMTDEQIVETLHTFVTKEINYSFVPFLNTNYVPKKPGATLSGKVGDCKDVATLMISLLRENGINAWFTLAETNSFSRQQPRPTLYAFNHAIIAYQLKDGKTRYADLTTDYYPNGILPEFDSDAWGLVIKDGETSVVRLPNNALDPTLSRVEISAIATVNKDKNITLEVNSTNFGCPGGRWREELIPATAEDRRKKISEYFGGGVLTHLDYESIDFENLQETNEPLRAKIRMTGFNQLDKVSNFWIMPLPLPLSTPTSKSLFAAKRYNDLDLDVLFELAPVREKIDLTLPAGFSILEMPQNQTFSTRFGDYSLRFESLPNNSIRVIREVTFKMRFIPHYDFLEFKEFYLKMLDADDVKLAMKG
jgi:transglutaminase-like putative cysteine protease